MVLKGSLKVTTLPEIVHSICVSKETGILTLQLFNMKKKIYFEDGKVAFAYSNQKKDSLGDVLLRNGIITLEQYMKTAKQIKPGLRHGQILLKEGIISTQELIAAVHSQVKEIIFSIFNWTEGVFEFEEEDGRKENIKLNITSSDLILSGVKRIDDWSVLQKMLGSVENILEESPDFNAKLAEIQLSNQELDIVNYAKGKTIKETLHYSLLNDFETCRLLAGFITIDLLRVRKTEHFVLEPVTDFDSEKIKRMVLLFNSIFEYIYQTLIDEAGPMAVKILNNYFEEVKRNDKDLLFNITLGEKGNLDSDLLYLNIMNLSSEDKTDFAYNVFLKILNSQLKAARELLGEEKRQHLEEDIKRVVDRMSDVNG